MQSFSDVGTIRGINLVPLCGCQIKCVNPGCHQCSS